jgi:hypothetical protein
VLKIDYLERISRAATILTFAIAIIVALAAPLLAISWSKRPFPGFFVEQTLIVNSINGENWSGRSAGIEYPQQVIRVAGVAVQTIAEFDAVMRSQEIGDEIAIITRHQNASIQLFPSVEVQKLPTSALVRYFWVLYGIGIVYLGIGIWVYLVRGKSRTGRALSFFCAATALGTMLIFDLSSTHLMVVVWISAVALAAGSLISLGMRFPVEWPIIKILPWLLAVPYGFSIALAIWGFFSAYNIQKPWAYIDNWETTYRYAVVAIVIFLGMIVYHAVTNPAYRVKQQSRIVLLGSVIAFVPSAFLFMTSRTIGFHEILLVFLPAFPISVAIAVMRYNLWKVDALVNRAFVYAILTTLLTGIFTAFGELLKRVFLFATGENSNVIYIITAFIVGSLVKPIQKAVDQFVNRRISSNTPEKTRELTAFEEQIRSHLFFNDPDLVTIRLLEELASGLNAQACAVVVESQGVYQISHVYGPWRGNAVASVPLICQEHNFGTLFIGPNATGVPYAPEEFEIVRKVTDQVARVIYLSLHDTSFIQQGSMEPRKNKSLPVAENKKNGNQTTA